MTTINFHSNLRTRHGLDEFQYHHNNQKNELWPLWYLILSLIFSKLLCSFVAIASIIKGENNGYYT